MPVSYTHLDKERELTLRLQKLQQMEKEIKEKEKSIKQNEKAKKQVILRIAPSLWEEISRWADEDFRSINSLSLIHIWV